MPYWIKARFTTILAGFAGIATGFAIQHYFGLPVAIGFIAGMFVDDLLNKMK